MGAWAATKGVAPVKTSHAAQIGDRQGGKPRAEAPGPTGGSKGMVFAADDEEVIRGAAWGEFRPISPHIPSLAGVPTAGSGTRGQKGRVELGPDPVLLAETDALRERVMRLQADNNLIQHFNYAHQTGDRASNPRHHTALDSLG
jgi:hypothetical protein